MNNIREKCGRCGIFITFNNNFYKTNNRKKNCKNCNPSTPNKKYRYDDYLGWIADYFEGRCDNCDTIIFYTNPLSFYKRCKCCNPSDDHNIYKYDEVNGNYIHQKYYKWDNQTRKHYWSAENMGSYGFSYSCEECKKEEARKNKILQYEKIATDIKCSTDNTEVYDITIEGILKSHTNMSKDVIGIVKEYFDFNYENSDLSGMNLSGLTLKKYTFTNCNFTGSNLSKTNLTDVKFFNCHMIKVSMRKTTMYNIIFSGSDLSGVDFTRSTITNVSSKGCDLIYAIYEECTIKNSFFPNSEVAKASFKHTFFEGVSFDSLNMRETVLSNTTFYSCTFNCAILCDNDLHDINFTKCTLPGTRFDKCEMNGIIFTSCTLYESFFPRKNCRNITFEKCELIKIELKGDIRRATFRNCNSIAGLGL